MKSPWLKSYPAGVATEIEIKHNSLVDLLHQSCHKYSNKPAFKSLGHTMTYKSLMCHSRDFAAFLHHNLNVKQGDRIALMLPNMLQHPVCFFGALQAGLAVVNINPLYTASELAKQLADSGAETIVVLSAFAHVVEQALPHTNVKNVIITELGDLCGILRAQIIKFATRKTQQQLPSWNIPNTLPLTKILKLGRRLKTPNLNITKDDIALLQYTGGTTGISKAAMLTHENLLANVEQCVAWMHCKLEEATEVCFTVLPLYHIFALTACCLIFMRIGGLNVLVPNPRNIKSVVKLFKQNHITALMGVNSLFNGLVNNASFRKTNFEHLKLTIAGGMAVQKPIAEKWHKITGNVVLEGYGLTEASPVVSISPLDQAEFSQSIGLPMPSTQVTIRDDNGNELPIGTEGELCVQGPQVMQGYWQQQEETELVFWPGGWLRTGDIAVMDNNGFFYIVDRKKDMIVTAGYNVYPREIEDVIMHCPGVSEVAVIGVPSKHAGETVKAFIVRKDESLTKDTIIAYCREQLVSYKIPKRIEFMRELPKSNVGKILKRALREQ